MRTNDGRLYVIAGASRSGKTAWTLRQVKPWPRVIVWDPEDQWSQLAGFKRISNPKALLEACNKPGAAKLAYVAGSNLAKNFDLFAGCAFRWGRLHGGCIVVAEELADVSNAGKAPGKWGVLVRRGLKRNISIFAISQRWAEADKTAVGNASEFICFRMASGDDVSYMARKTRIAIADLEGLKPLEFVRYDSGSGATERGKLRF